MSNRIKALSGQKAPVNRILRSSIVDGPGNRAVVFLQGCNFNCLYCHNPETISLCCGCGQCIDVCPAGALSRDGAVQWRQEACILCDACIKACPYHASPRVRLLSPEAVMAEIEPSIPFIRGITLSGGECTIYPEFLRSLGALAKERGLSFFLDSNGNYDYEGDPDLMAVTDSVMLDIKADPENPAEYRRVTGYSGEYLIERAEYLTRAGKLWELRTVVSPGLFDAAAVVDRMCRVIAAVLKGPFAPPAGKEPRYKLIRYRPMGVRKAAAETLVQPGNTLMDELAGICAGYGIKAAAV